MAPPDRLTEAFIRELTLLGGVGVELSGAGRIVDYIAHQCLAHKASSVVLANRSFLTQLGVDSALRAVGVNVFVVGEPGTTGEVLSKADVGIVEADAAVAETGTIGLVTTNDADRLVSCLPPTLISLVGRGSVVNSLQDAFSLIQSQTRSLPRHAVSLITGPSKTADIELKLVKGVHGPRAVYCIIHREQRS